MEVYILSINNILASHLFSGFVQEFEDAFGEVLFFEVA